LKEVNVWARIGEKREEKRERKQKQKIISTNVRVETMDG
jgi:hypothetical protein